MKVLLTASNCSASILSGKRLLNRSIASSFVIFLISDGAGSIALILLWSLSSSSSSVSLFSSAKQQQMQSIRLSNRFSPENSSSNGSFLIWWLWKVWRKLFFTFNCRDREQIIFYFWFRHSRQMRPAKSTAVLSVHPCFVALLVAKLRTASQL